jgi:hypothetical protein
MNVIIIYSTTMIDVLYVIKWILLVFIAGCIGYFGKYIGMQIIGLMRRRKTRAQQGSGVPGKEDTETPGIRDKYDYKLEKKRLKYEKKRLKEQEKNKKDD